MAKRFRFQFSLTDEDTVKQLQVIPSIYRALYVEMALGVWFRSDNAPNTGKMNSTIFHSESKEAFRSIRFRISIADEKIISSLRTIPSRHRSLITEMALAAWIETKPGRKAFEVLSSRNMKHARDAIKLLDEKPIQTDRNDKSDPVAIESDADTERLIKNLLEFE